MDVAASSAAATRAAAIRVVVTHVVAVLAAKTQPAAMIRAAAILAVAIRAVAIRAVATRAAAIRTAARLASPIAHSTARWTYVVIVTRKRGIAILSAHTAVFGSRIAISKVGKRPRAEGHLFKAKKESQP